VKFHKSSSEIGKTIDVVKTQFLRKNKRRVNKIFASRGQPRTPIIHHFCKIFLKIWRLNFVFDPKLSLEIRNKSTRKMSVNNSMRFIPAFFWYYSSDLLCKHGRQAARRTASQWHWEAGCSGSSKGSGRPIGEAMGNPGARDGGPTARTQKSPKTVKKIAPEKFEIRKTQIGYP